MFRRQSYIVILFAIGVPLFSQRATDVIEPKAGSWKTWVLKSGSQLRLPPPPDDAATAAENQWLRDFRSPTDTGERERAEYWSSGSPGFRWVEMVTERILDERIARPGAPRVYALVTVAIYDATIAAWDSKYTYNRRRPGEIDPALALATAAPRSPSYPSEHAAVAMAVAGVLSYLYPSDAAYFNALAEDTGRSRLTLLHHFPSDVMAGYELGRAVAEKVIEYARNDGTDTPWTGTVPTGPGLWIGTNPLWVNASFWTPWVLVSPSEFRPPPPPAYDSPTTAAELAEIKNFPRDFNASSKAFFWQTLEGNFTWFMDQVSRRLFEYDLHANPPRAARAYALMGVATFDMFAASHDAKYVYWRIRPNQLDPSVTTLFANPNHPSYPANHGMTSVRTGVLAYLFPTYADYYRAIGDEIGWSRMWAGIHYRSDIEAGFAMAQQVVRKIVEHAESDGSKAVGPMSP
jgi:membrane-associated phospholipid phosphatase